MPQWYHKQDEGISAVDIPEAAKRVLQGAIDSRVDVGALSNNGTLGHSAEKYDTGVRDLTSQRVMVLIKATGEALSVQVRPCWLSLLVVAHTRQTLCGLDHLPSKQTG